MTEELFECFQCNTFRPADQMRITMGRVQHICRLCLSKISKQAAETRKGVKKWQPGDKLKQCKGCYQFKSLDRFRLEKSGCRRSNCKDCANKLHRDSRKRPKNAEDKQPAKYPRGTKEYRNAAIRRWLAKLRTQTLNAYGHKCSCCGETNAEFLAIDHINNDGEKDRKAGFRGGRMYLRLRREGFPKDKYRLLCHNCNMSNAFYGYCPHQQLAGLPKQNQQDQHGKNE